MLLYNVCNTTYNLIHEGHTINELQIAIILSVFEIQKIQNIRFVGT